MKEKQNIEQSGSGSGVGQGIDIYGGPVVDPTSNVFKFVEMAVRRLDDLRVAHEKMIDHDMGHRAEITNLYAMFAKEVRQVDVLAVKTEAERVLVAVQTLAAQTATDREKLRTDVATTAQAIAKQTADDRAQIIEQIAALQKSSYEGAGKEKVSDPMMALMVQRLETLSNTMSVSTGRGIGIEKVMGLIVGSGGLAALLGYLAAHFTK